MKSQMLNLFFLTTFLAFVARAAPIWAPEDTLTGEKSVFKRLIAANGEAAITGSELSTLIQDYLSQFVDTPVDLSGASLSEKLVALANLDLAKHLNDPILDPVQLTNEVKILFDSYKEKIYQGDEELLKKEFLPTVRAMVYRHMAAVLITSGQPSYNIQDQLSQITAKIESVNTSVQKSQNEGIAKKGENFKAWFSEIKKNFSSSTSMVEDLIYTAHNPVSSFSTNFEKTIAQLSTPKREAAIARAIELLTHYLRLLTENSKQKIITIEDLFKIGKVGGADIDTAFTIIQGAMEKLRTEVPKTYVVAFERFFMHGHLINKLRTIHEGIIPRSKRYCYFQTLNYQNKGLPLSRVDSAHPQAQHAILATLDMLFGYEACHEGKLPFVENDIALLVKNLKVLYELKDDLKLTISSYPAFFANNGFSEETGTGFSIDNNFAAYDALYNLYLDTRISEGFNRNNNMLPAYMNTHLDKLAVAANTEQAQPFDVDTHGYYLFLKAMLAMNRSYPAEQPITFISDKTDMLEESRNNIQQSDMVALKSFASKLLIKVLDKDLNLRPVSWEGLTDLSITHADIEPLIEKEDKEDEQKIE